MRQASSSLASPGLSETLRSIQREICAMVFLAGSGASYLAIRDEQSAALSKVKVAIKAKKIIVSFI